MSSIFQTFFKEFVLSSLTHSIGQCRLHGSPIVLSHLHITEVPFDLHLQKSLPLVSVIGRV